MKRHVHPFRRLTDDDARAIRSALSGPEKTRASYYDVSLAFNTSVRSIGRIVRGETWTEELEQARDVRRRALAYDILFMRTNFLNPDMETEKMNATANTLAVKPEDQAIATPKPGGKYYTLNATLTQCVAPDGTVYDVTLTPNAPPIIRDKTGKINKGKPTSVYDLNYEIYHGKRLKGNHAVSPSRKFDLQDLTLSAADVLTPKQLHKEAQERQTRGRKSTITVDLARSIKSSHYQGKTPAKDLADNAEYGSLSLPTIKKILNGESMWYA